MGMKLAHVGVAVKEFGGAVKLFSSLFGRQPDRTETVADQHVQIAFFHAGSTAVELTAATAPDSPIAQFLEKRGEGVHHLSFEVEDIHAEIARLKAAGFRMIDEQPRLGAGNSLIAFVHPMSTGGVLIELCQVA